MVAQEQVMLAQEQVMLAQGEVVQSPEQGKRGKVESWSLLVCCTSSRVVVVVFLLINLQSLHANRNFPKI